MTASHIGLRSVCLGESTQPFNYSLTHAVIQQYFESYAPALYTQWSKYKN